MKFAITLFSLILLSACQSLPTPNQTQQADYGLYPENYKSIVNLYLKNKLRDPATVDIKAMTSPVKRWIGDKITGTTYGYLVCVDVNSKNLFGKMTGVRSDAVLIRNKEVVKYVKDGELVSGMQLCN